MRILALTTDTVHHAFFVMELLEKFDDVYVFAESGGVVPRYPVAHPFEVERDFYESTLWFNGVTPKLNKIASRLFTYENLNDDGAVSKMRSLDPDVAIVFGTRKLSENVINVIPDCFFNLHGGDPQNYRGLDSHLWAIWHGELSELKVCMHRLTKDLDDGAIFQLRGLALEEVTQLHQLRSVNTEMCLSITCDLLDQIRLSGKIKTYKQASRGRYYSFMPSVLKSECVRKFQKLVAGVSLL